VSNQKLCVSQIMGPSGAGKTTLISALTLDAHFGKATGGVTLNQVPLTGPIFKKHCFGTLRSFVLSFDGA
jgi:ABC-type lipoprotein export system ATPase subunit